LAGILKDAIPRYKTMRGYCVNRRWGWDCHGLPIEKLVQDEQKLNTKKDIENLDIELPILTPRIQREYKNLDLLNVAEFKNNKK
jgi:isoleucyl-tRNA synthetase